MSRRDTQRTQILALLLEARGAEVPLPQILELKISQFGARILELRREGHRIINRTANVDGQKHSWYRLESGSAPLATSGSTTSTSDRRPTLGAAPIVPAGAGTLPLFDSRRAATP